MVARHVHSWRSRSPRHATATQVSQLPPPPVSLSDSLLLRLIVFEFIPPGYSGFRRDCELLLFLPRLPAALALAMVAGGGGARGAVVNAVDVAHIQPMQAASGHRPACPPVGPTSSSSRRQRRWRRRIPSLLSFLHPRSSRSPSVRHFSVPPLSSVRRVPVRSASALGLSAQRSRTSPGGGGDGRGGGRGRQCQGILISHTHTMWRCWWWRRR